MTASSAISSPNPGIPFDPAWVEIAPQSASFDFETRTQEATKSDIRLIASLLDLTSLNSDDTEARILGLFEDAIEPLPGDRATVAGICVYPAFLGFAGTWIRDRGVRLVAACGGFPHGLAPIEARMSEISACAKLADEVDFPIPRYLALEQRWDELYLEIKQLVGAARGATTKVILATGELPDQQAIYRAATVAMMAGASFVKTSTGKERVNARIDAGAALCRAIRDYDKRTGHRVGLKPAGGIRSAGEAMQWISLVREKLGDRWLTPDMFRIGASTLLEHLRYEYEERP